MNYINYSNFSFINECTQARRDRDPYPMKHQIYLCRRWLCQWPLMRFTICLACCYLCPILNANAQTHKVDFDASKWSGCEPLAVQFQNLSDPGYTSLNWSFSVGADVTDPNPGRIFNVAGTYKITLTVTYPDGVIKKEKTVTVYKKPVPAFSTSVPGGCAPLAVTFTDQSTPGDGTITSVTWDFGDGINGSGSTATHTYTLGGNQTASIIVINSFGCTNGSTQLIKVQDAPTVKFSSDVQSSCTTPLAVQFTNTSSTVNNAPLTYTWNFGDGTTSTATAPQHTYTKEGKYTVTLTATTAEGCKQSVSAPDYIQIAKMKPDFTVPASNCVGRPVILRNTTTPTPLSARWDFPDGSVQYSMDANYTFTQPGDYAVKLTTFGNGCQETITKTVHVNPLPTADFTASPNPDCHVPTTTKFTAQTPDATTWAWDFGDGGTATTQNPTHSYTADGNYTVSLLAINKFGCGTTVVKTSYMLVQEPWVDFVMTANSGCIPFSVGFTAQVSSVDPVVKYTWDFGDGTTATNITVPSHYYSKEGDYTITLEIETKSGCKLSASHVIEAGDTVKVDFDVDHYKGCQSDIFNFTNKSVPAGTEWLWNFPQDNSGATGQNPSHQFNEIGFHDVTLTVINNGCYNILTKRLLIEINPPAARFSVLPDCINKYDRQFYDASDFGNSVTKTWLWNFGDGTTSTDQSPKHTYAKTGTYTVKLTVGNGSCTSNLSQIIHIIDENPVIKADTNSICNGDSITYRITNSLHYNMINVYHWEWGDGAYINIPAASFDSTAVYTHTYTTPGTYTVRLSLIDINGCPQQSNSLQVVVNGINADFTYTGTCKEKPFTFTDTSTPTSPGTTLSTWTWNFGDGSGNITQTQKPVAFSHAFGSMTTFPVTLTVTDKMGCKGTITKPVSVNVVATAIVVPGQEACLQKDFQFSSNSSGQSLTYAWSFGDGGTSTQAAPLYVYTKPGVYTIKLAITDIDGCKASQEALNFITVRNPQAVFDFPATLPPCPPVLVPFTNSSSDYDHIAWEFGDGSTSPEVSPGHAYSRPGSYTVALKVYTDGGCVSTASKTLTIQGPDGSQSATPTTGCMPLKIEMTAKSSNAVKYIWDFDDGHVITTATPTTSYEYTKEGIYHPRVILEDAKGCQVPALGNDQIVADKVTPRFTMDATQACDGGYVYFKDNSLSVTKDQLSLPMTYQWDFGIAGRTDDVSTDANPRFLYDQVGTYPVKLLVTTAYGCTGEVTLPTVVEPKPLAEIVPIEPVCVGTSVRLQGSDTKQLPGTKWVWLVTPDNTVFETATPPRVTLNTPGNNQVLLTISNGNGTCPDTAGTTVLVSPLPDLNPMPKQANICLGQSLELRSNVTPGADITWTDYQISDAHSPNPTIQPLHDTTYHVMAVNSTGCSREADIAVTVSQPHKVNAADAAICSGSQVQLHVSGAPHYKWIPATGLNKADVPDPVARPAVTTTYQVIGLGDDACFTDTALVTVTVNQAPTISAGPDQVVPVGSELRLQLQASPDVIKIEWRGDPSLSCTDCMAPLATPKQSVTYHVIATNQYSCVDIDEVNVKVVCTGSNVFVPNSFSPNGDGQNDIFYIRGRGIKSIKVFRIFNRWGEVVFERSDLNTEDQAGGWDGRFRGIPLNPDVFIYYAEMICDTNESFVLKGNVTLLR